MTTMTEEERRELWLAERRKAITSTDVGRLLGVTKFGGPMDVWLDKMGLSNRVPTERMAWGLRLQQAILEGYVERVQQPLVVADPYLLYRCPKLPVLGATLDARWRDVDERPVDAKNVGFKTKEWGDNDSDVIPHGYAIQLLVQMLCTGTKVAELAVLFGGNTLGVYRVHHDQALEDLVLERVDRFWRDHVEKGLPPDLDGSPAWTEFLQKSVKQQTEVLLASEPGVESDVRDLVAARALLDNAEALAARAENRIKAFIGSAGGVQGEWGRVKWTTSTKRVLDKDSYIQELETQVAKLDPGFALAQPSLKAQFETERQTRRFNLYVKEKP